MLDSLLGRKFSAKCKQSIKCINSRILLIRKRKQATLNILKNVVAELLASGRDTEALGRMDGLIIEMNKISCYDMIERFCECILSQMSSLQKQRECPEEEMEAVATLIFAAARFSDLPELSDLRHVFISRYGSALESSINREFVEKTSMKTFSNDMKLKLMQDISREFSVSWDYRVFNQKKSTSSAQDLPRKTAASTNVANQESFYVLKSTTSDTKQDMAIHVGKKDIPYYGRVEPPLTHLSPKEEMKEQAKYIHMMSNPNNAPRFDPPKKTRSAISDDTKSGASYSIGIGVHDSIPTDMKKRFNARDQKAQEDVARDQKAQEDVVIATKPSRTTRTRVDVQGSLKTDHDLTKKKSYNNEKRHSIDYYQNGAANGEPKSPHESHFFPSENQIAKSENVKEGFDAGGKERHFRELKMDKDMVPPDNNQRGYVNATQPVDNVGNGMPTSQRGFDPSAPENAPPKPDGKVKNMIPPYVRPKAHKPEAEVEDLNGAVISKLRNQQDLDLHVYENKPYKREAHVEELNDGAMSKLKNQQDFDFHVKKKQTYRPEAHVSNLRNEHNFDDLHVIEKQEYKPRNLDFHVKEKQALGDARPTSGNPPINRIPPYVKPSHKPDELHDNNIGRFNANENKTLPKDDFIDVEKPKPRSVRRKYPKPQLVHEHNVSVDDGELVSQRRHGERRRPGREDDYDEEEMEMDRLLIHFSKKGMTNRTSKSRTKIGTVPTDYATEGGHHKDQSEMPEKMRAPARAISLPTNRNGALETAKAPARMPSMQPDMPSPSGGRVHPRLPDYDELAAQFTALKRG